MFLNLELLDEAINKRKQTSFLYNSYDFDKKLKPRSRKPLVVDPYLLIAENENYYLVCKNHHFNNISFLRIDRMTDVKVLEKFATLPPEDVNLEAYSGKAHAIYFGEEELFLFRCRKAILNDVLDRFGPDVDLCNITEESFDFSVLLVDKAATFFALEYISRCEILSPEHSRERMRRYIRSGMDRYMEDED